MKHFLASLFTLATLTGAAQELQLNDLEYFERQGVNVLVFSNSFNGGFNDEKNSGIEIIHHGVRTIQGGAIRLNNTPEQWDLVPKMTSRTVDREKKSIEVALRYDDYDFDSRIVVTAKGKGVEIAVFLDKPVPAALAVKNVWMVFLWQTTFCSEYVEHIGQQLFIVAREIPSTHSSRTVRRLLGVPYHL